MIEFPACLVMERACFYLWIDKREEARSLNLIKKRVWLIHTTLSMYCGAKTANSPTMKERFIPGEIETNEARFTQAFIHLMCKPRE
jgi:hypothetical protein